MVDSIFYSVIIHDDNEMNTIMWSNTQNIDELTAILDFWMAVDSVKNKQL